MTAAELAKRVKGAHRSGAGYRRVDKMNLATRCFGSHLLGERRIDRTTIDPKCIWPKVIQKSIDAHSCVFNRVRMSQHCEQHVHLFGEFRRLALAIKEFRKPMAN